MTTSQRGIVLGDPAPWFGAPLLTGGSCHLQVAAGHWIVLAFLGSAQDPRALNELEALWRAADRFDPQEILFYGVIASPPSDPAPFFSRSGPAAGFITDYDGALARLYGADGSPRTVVLDPMLRAVANVSWDVSPDVPGGHADTVCDFVRALPKVDDNAGVPLVAPLLVVPRVFDFALCDALIDFYHKVGGEDSGFLLDHGGETARVFDYGIKRRSDVHVVHPVLREAMRDQIVRRLLPAVARFFQFEATRLDRYIVCCYDSAVGAHF